MTQSSRPQADNVNTNPAYVDSGPYTRDEWAQKLIIEWVGDYVTDRGPFAKYLNRLEVTNPVLIDIQIDTGAGYCNGSILDNDAAVTITADIPAANPRIDIVCMVENNTNAEVSDGTAANGWTFPAADPDYTATPAIPPYSTRIVIVKGAEAGAPVAPVLDQSNTLYMVPLAQYQISVVPAISAFTDLRDYVDAETKILFIQPQGAYNSTDGTVISPTRTSQVIGLAFDFPDNKVCLATGRINLPADYIDTMTVEGVIYHEIVAGGDIYATLSGGYGQDNTSPAVRVDAGAYAAETVNATGRYSYHRQLSVTTPIAEDILRFQFTRDATNILDTLGDTVIFVGFVVKYLGWRVA